MAVISGYGGKLNGVDCMMKWSVDPKAGDNSFVTSNTNGGTGRVDGLKDWTGSYDAQGHSPIVLPGQAFSFAGAGSGGKGASGTAIVDSVNIKWPIAERKPIIHTVSFSGNGDLTLGAVSATADADAIFPVNAGPLCLAKICTVAVPATFTEIAGEIQSIDLTITCSNKEYAASTGQKRLAGNLDFTVAIAILHDDLSTVPALNSENGLQLFVDAEDCWLLKWVRWLNPSGFVVDPEGGAIVGCTLNGSMAAVASDDSYGTITLPGEATAFWPAA